MALPAQITTNLFPDFKNSFIGPFAKIIQEAQETENGLTVVLGSTTSAKSAQSFQTATAGELASVDLFLTKIGSPTDSITVGLYSDNAGEPGTLLASGVTIPPSRVAGVARYVKSTFVMPYPLTVGSTYWIQAEKLGSGSGTNHYTWLRHSSGPYGSGELKQFTTVWTGSLGDAKFKINISIAGRYQPCVDKINNKVRMFKSTDGGDTWSEQNSANAPTITSTANTRTISAAQQDNLIAVILPETTTFYKVFRFNTSSDLWETSSWASSSSVSVNTNVSGAAPLPFAYRPFAATNTYAAAYNGAVETVMGSPRRRVKVKRTATASPGYDLIGSPNTADLTTLPGTAVDYDLRAALHDGNGIWHCWWTQSDDSNLRHRSFDPDATTFATLNLMGSTPAVTSNSAAYPVGVPTNYYRSGEWYLAIPYVDSGALKVSRVKAIDAATAANWTNTTVLASGAESTNSNPAVLVADNEQGGKLFLIYTKTDGKFYYTHDQANDLWVTEQELHPGTKTVGAISGGVMVDSIGVCYLDTAPATDDLKFDSL